MKGILFIISSPSGGGKGTLIREALRSIANLSYSISFTTRAMREGEMQGRDYFFVSPSEFEKLIKDGEFLEYADVHGNFYGTSRSQVEKETNPGRDIILEIDVQGAESIRKLLPDAVGIFILPPSFQVLRERLALRQTETKESLALRLQNASKEVEHYKEFDYVVVNDEVTKAALELQSIILAERLKLNRQDEKIKDILQTFENFKTNLIGD